MRSLLFVLLLLLGSADLFAQNYPVVSYSTEEGLPQSQVTSFAQDDDGYLWIGTLGGLARYGGQKFLTFSSNDGLLNNRISALEFFDNTLWIGHDGGISYMRNGKVSKVEFDGNGNDRSRKVSKIIQFRGKILVCSLGGGLFELKGKKLINIALPYEDNNWIRGAYDYNGTLFLATRKGILTSKDGYRFTLRKEFGILSFSGITGKGNNLFLSAFNDGCILKNMETGSLKRFSAQELVHSILGCYYDREGRIWLSTNHGIVRVEKNGELLFIDGSQGLPIETISCFYNDNANNVWIGSLGKGMFRFPTADFRYFDQSSGFPSDLYLGGFEDKGEFYFATYDQGVFKQAKDGTITPIIEDLMPIWASLKNVDGKHWFGGNQQLTEVDPVTGETIVHTPESDDELPGWKITALYKISENSMYVGGNGGVSIYENGVFRRIGKDGDMGTVRDFQVVKGKLYCVTNLGLYVYEKNEFKIAFGLTDLAYSIELDEHGSMWYGTEEGLFKIRNGKSVRVPLLSDPASNFIDFLYVRGNELYVGTNNGLFVLSELQSELPVVVHFGVQEGVIDLETNLNSGFFDERGDFWFGTASGLVRYHPRRDSNSGVPPSLNLVSVLLNYEPFTYSKYAGKVSDDGLPLSLVLPHSMNNLIFEFDGVSLKMQKGLRYQFLLEGLNENWSPPSESPTITLTSIPAGEYTLRVRCLDREDRLSDVFEFPFTVASPFYRTWWFVISCILFIGGLVLLIFRLRIMRIAERNDQEMLVYTSRLLSLEQKSMNASMNRHFIFNALNSIQYFINTQDRVSANKYLTNFANLIRKNLDSVTASGNVITLEEELERLELYLSLESMRFKGRFEYAINLHGVDAESALIPPMLMQPFIENSIIHGILPNEEKLGKILINVEQHEEYLYIRIEDNGIGIRNSLSKKLSADGDHRSQGMEITSKRIELIQKISNNGISLEGPEEIIGDDGSINGTYVLIKIPGRNLEN